MRTAPMSEATFRFEREIVPHIEMLTRVAISMRKNPHDAEDLVQDTLLKAFRSIDTFDGRYPRAWLLTIMRNSWASRYKSNRLQVDPWVDIESQTLQTSHIRSRRPEEDVIDREFVAAVKAAVDDLPLHQKEIVTLVDLLGLSYEEAANLLDVPVGTVMSRLHRARTRIRDKLARSGLDPFLREVRSNE